MVANRVKRPVADRVKHPQKYGLAHSNCPHLENDVNLVLKVSIGYAFPEPSGNPVLLQFRMNHPTDS